MASVNEQTEAAAVVTLSGVPDGPGAVAIAMEQPPNKKKSRQRLLRGLQRISSSPSLAQLGRPRAASAPYSLRGTLSCVSLAPDVPPAASNTSTSPSSAVTSPLASTPAVGTPAAESYFPLGIDERLAARKVENATAVNHPPTTVAIPTDIKAAKNREKLSHGKPRPDARNNFNFWGEMPHEIRVHVFSFLQPKELVRASLVSKAFHAYCFDGQLWTSLDATEFYQDIPAESLAKIIVAAGPFVKDLNLRGCVQVEHYKRAEAIVKSCRNLINATLEGCRNLQQKTLHSLLKTNENLAHINLTGLTAVNNQTCRIIAASCPQLEGFNVSWCTGMDSEGILHVVENCKKLRDVRAGEVRGFRNEKVADAIFKTNRLERLVLSGCQDLSDAALRIMAHGRDPEFDILTDRPIVPPRKLRHLDLSRCVHITSHGLSAFGHLVPELEGLQLSGCSGLTDAALEPLLASTPRLTHLELEDIGELTNHLLSEHLAKAPCAPKLEHLSISYCENIGDIGMLPVVRKCVRLKSIDMDNTRISDLVLAEAAVMVRQRAARTTDVRSRPRVGLSMMVYDCQNVTWTGVREVLCRNAEIKGPSTRQSYPTEIISLKCFYGWQMTVDEHTKRVLAASFGAASRLDRKWADYMQANAEAGVGGAGNRRRRRRAREAQQVHADEEEGGTANGTGRRRARTAACAVM